MFKPYFLDREDELSYFDKQMQKKGKPLINVVLGPKDTGITNFMKYFLTKMMYENKIQKIEWSFK